MAEQRKRGLTKTKACKILHYSRQNYYKRKAEEAKQGKEKVAIIELVNRVRTKLPTIGTRKLMHMIKADINTLGIKCGRDKLFKYLREENLLIKPKKRYVQTTFSKHWMRKYPNIFKSTKIAMPEQAFVSDITYLDTDNGFCYLSLVTDAYSRKIVGFNLSKSMSANETVKAFVMAIKSRIYPESKLMHHSDRGLQYCSKRYVETARKAKIKISMTENSSPYDNALAERINRTLKEEFNLYRKFKNIEEAYEAVKEAILLYNNFRPHLSLSFFTPEIIHKNPQLLGAIGG